MLRKQGAVYTSHGQTLGAFNRDFVATGRFPKDITRVLTRLFKDRQLGDYEVLVTVDAETAQLDVEDTSRLVQLCRDLVNRSESS